jgi:hypothetical protein
VAGLDALYLVAAAVLLVAGLAKLRSPEATAAALRDAGLPGTTSLVRGLGGVEVLVGGVALLVGGRVPAVALGAAYLAVTLVAWRQRRAGADCGCFGASGTPVSGWHLGVNAMAVVVAGAAGVVGTAGLPVVIADAPWSGLPTLAALTVAVLLVRAALTVLPELQAARALHPTEVEA